MTEEVIYCVELKITRQRASEFDSWLVEHITEMLALPGFVSADSYKELDENTPELTRVVHYRLASFEHLAQYFGEYAEEMRAKGSRLFSDDLSATRKILQAL